MKPIDKSITDTIIILDVEGRVLKFAPDNALAPLIIIGNSLAANLAQRISTLQLDLLQQQIRAARLTRQSTSSQVDLTIDHTPRKFLASFWSLDDHLVVMLLRDVTELQHHALLVERRHREMMTLQRLAKIMPSTQDPAWVLDWVLKKTGEWMQAQSA